jgi:hypothetical protein
LEEGRHVVYETLSDKQIASIIRREKMSEENLSLFRRGSILMEALWNILA